MQMIRPTHKFFSLETEYYRDTVCVYKCLNLVLYDLHDVVMVGVMSLVVGLTIVVTGCVVVGGETAVMGDFKRVIDATLSLMRSW